MPLAATERNTNPCLRPSSRPHPRCRVARSGDRFKRAEASDGRIKAGHLKAVEEAADDVAHLLEPFENVIRLDLAIDVDFVRKRHRNEKLLPLGLPGASRIAIDLVGLDARWTICVTVTESGRTAALAQPVPTRMVLV